VKPIIHLTSTADLRAENRIVKGGQVRDNRDHLFRAATGGVYGI
jgi:hypothetical protein